MTGPTRLAGRRGLGLAFALGALAALGQAPFGLWGVTLAAVAGLIWLIARPGTGGRRSFWLGWAAGTGYFLLSLSWIVEPFLVDIARHGWMAPFAVLFLSSGLGLFWAAPAALAWQTPRPALGFVAAFALLEWYRGVILTGFPWAMLGHVWIGTAADQVAAIGGASGLSLLVLLPSALPVQAGRRGLALAVLMLALAFGFGAWRLAEPLPAPRDLTLRLVQPNAEQSAKWEQSLADEHLTRLLDLTAQGQVADLTIWPETAVPFMLEYAPVVAGMVTDASGGRPVAVGIQREGAGLYYNSLRVLSGEGAEIASYDKHHLVPFGEYIPFGDLAYDWFGITAFAAQTGAAYSAGPGPRVMDLGSFGKVLPLICYEAVFPRDVSGVDERADWMLQITNDAWFGVWTGPFQHFAQARLRAVEQGLPLVRVANTGVTAVIDARGRVTAALPFGTMGVLDSPVPAALEPTPYARWGDTPVLLLIVALSMLPFLRPPRGRH